MGFQNNQKSFISIWQVAKILWLAQSLSSLFFGIPVVMMVLFAANINLVVALQVAFFYLVISFTIFVPINWLLSLVSLKAVKTILNKSRKNDESLTTKKKLWATGELLNLPFRLSIFSFIVSFLGFVSGLILLWRGLIPGLIPLIEATIALGLAIGFVVCLVQSSLIYIFLESYFRPKIEILKFSYSEIIKATKIRRFSIFGKIFFLVLSTVIVAQVSLWALYLGRIIIYSPKDIKNGLIYIGIVAILTLFYVTVIAFHASKNLVSPIKKIISWADKIIKGETKEEIFLTTNDEIAELIEYLKKMYGELEEIRASLEIKVEARTKELKELNERQEEVIRERIKEIQKKTEELEKFQRLAVGRELKMIELKKEIKKLKELLERKSK